MDTMHDKEDWHLIHNDNGEWISDDYAVFVNKDQLKSLQAEAVKIGNTLSVQHGPDESLWCYKHEINTL